MVRLDPESPAATMKGVPIIEYYRRTDRRAFRHVFSVGALLVGIGGITVAWGLLHRTTAAGSVATAMGVFIVASGPLSTILGLRKLLLEESYLAVRRDGLLLRRDDLKQPEIVIGWDGIKGFSVDAASGGVTIRLEDSAPLLVDMALDGITAPELVKRLEQHRLRAAHGLLR